MGEEYKVGPPVELRLKWTGYLWDSTFQGERSSLSSKQSRCTCYASELRTNTTFRWGQSSRWRRIEATATSPRSDDQAGISESTPTSSAYRSCLPAS
jgi:hypothetical protein